MDDVYNLRLWQGGQSLPLRKMSMISLEEKRLQLCSRIAHYRLMIKRNYHPEFFQKLTNRALEQQRRLLNKERIKQAL